MKRNLPLLAFLMLSLDGIAQCAAPQNVFAFTYEGKTYEIIKENKTWVNAAACAVSRGGYLAEVNSLEENNAIFNQLALAGVDPGDTPATDGFSSYVWLGGNDISSEGNWVWNGNNDTTTTAFWQGTASGSAVNGNFTNWGNEPDNWGTGSGQDGLGMAVIDWPLGTAGHWNDVKHTNALFFVVEYDTTAATNIAPKAVVSLYPNPATDVVKVTTDAPVKTISLYTMAGQKVKQVHYYGRAAAEISVAGLLSGVYIVIIDMEDGSTAKNKLVRE